MLLPLSRSKPKFTDPEFDNDNDEPNDLPAPLAVLLSPLFTLAGRTISNHTYQRMQSSVFEPVFQVLSPPACPRPDSPPSRKRARLAPSVAEPDYPNVATHSCLEDPKEEGTLERGALRKGILKAFFTVASDQETRDSNRRKMYALWRKCEEGDEDEGVSDGGVDAR